MMKYRVIVVNAEINRIDGYITFDSAEAANLFIFNKKKEYNIDIFKPLHKRTLEYRGPYKYDVHNKQGEDRVSSV